MRKNKVLKWLSRYKQFPLRVWVLGIVLLAVFSGLVAFLVSPGINVQDLNRTYLDQMTRKSLQTGILTSFSKEMSTEVQDYAFYGETLTFYQSDYDPMITDASFGLNVVLRNVETGEENSFFFSGGADSGIPTGELEPGLYELYLNEQYKKKRIYFPEETVLDSFATVRRNGMVTEVDLFADADYFADQDIYLDRDYAFLMVTEKVPMVKTVDVMIDPGGNVYNDLTLSSDPGYVWQDMTEADLSMELARLVKENLEAAGLRVAFTRTEDENPGYYGDSGRVAAGYDKQAKVFLNLSMTSEEDTSRPYLVISPFVTGNLGNAVASAMKEAGIEMEYVHNPDLTDASVVYDSLQQNEDWTFNQFSLHPQLRETGGKITSAGGSADTSGNKEYADAWGMYGLMVEYANAADDDSMRYYLENKEEIAAALAQGILDYFQIGEKYEAAAQ